MILYVNGDSHSAGAEAVNDFSFAQDDPKLWQDEWFNKPHPDNLKVSYGQLLANSLQATFICDALPAASNSRILRTTRNYLKTNKPDLIIIGWTSFEREEWFDEETNFWYQVNGSGIDSVPEKWIKKYKDYVINIDWEAKEIFWYNEIWNFHRELEQLNVPHLFFICYRNFHYIKNAFAKKGILLDTLYDFKNNFINPYIENFDYIKYLQSCGCELHRKPYEYPRITQPRNHFGPDGHAKWAEFLLPYLTRLL